METNYLIGLSLFDTQEIPINELRDYIFRQTGWASTRALPPIVPLFFIKKDFSRNKIKDILNRCKPALNLCPGKIKEAENGLFLGFDSGVNHLNLYINELKEAMAPWQTERTIPSFPFFPGVFLGIIEEDPVPELKGDEFINEIKDFSTFNTVLIQLCRNLENEHWWFCLEWEVILSVKNKK